MNIHKTQNIQPLWQWCDLSLSYWISNILHCATTCSYVWFTSIWISSMLSMLLILLIQQWCDLSLSYWTSNILHCAMPVGLNAALISYILVWVYIIYATYSWISTMVHIGYVSCSEISLDCRSNPKLSWVWMWAAFIQSALSICHICNICHILLNIPVWLNQQHIGLWNNHKCCLFSSDVCLCAFRISMMLLRLLINQLLIIIN